MTGIATGTAPEKNGGMHSNGQGILRSTRGRIAIGILIVWLIGLGLLARRQLQRSNWDRLTEAAARLDPAAFYYQVYQGDSVVGVASSMIDTSMGRMRTTDFFRGRLVIYGDTQKVEGSVTSYFSRRMALDSFALAVGGEQKPFTIRGQPENHKQPVFLPTTLPIALMLTGDPEKGRDETFWVYNPIAREVQRTTLTIADDSLFTVSDSARYDTQARRWVSAHTDTVRAWSVAPSTSGLTVWVDAQGRVVHASEPGGMTLTRTSYEEAFSNWRTTGR